MTKPLNVPKWPTYSPECRAAMGSLLFEGGPMSAYRANRDHGVGPAEHSWAWRLEREAEKMFRAKHAIAVNSGTAALVAALRALDIEGKEVITTPYSFSATASAILLAGGTPVFADVDPCTYCITLETVRPHVSKKTRAILPVHLFGLLPDLSPLMSLEIPIIEDACQAVGASREGKYAGTYGIAGCYSFQGGKQVPAGEGGMIVTDDESLARRARLYANHAENFGMDFVGQNYRPTEMQCLLAWHGLVELKTLLPWRRKYVKSLLKMLPPTIHPQTWDYPTSHSFYVFGFTQSRYPNDALKAKMARKGIPIGVGYIIPPLHHYKAFKKYAKGPLPVVDSLSFMRLSVIPWIQPFLRYHELARFAESLSEIMDA